MPTAQHTESETHPWTIEIPDHPPRSDSPEYVASRKLMNQLDPGLYGKHPVQDHHGGGLWAWHGDDPDHGEIFLVMNLVGMEWSSQFCADPAKVDRLRVNAQHFYSGFPKSADRLGIGPLLDTPITDAAGVETWVDSIANASVPLPAGLHVGVVSKNDDPAGIHHYPWPVASIGAFKYDDFVLFVPTSQGTVAVTPAGPRGSGNGAVVVQYAQSTHPLRAKLRRAKKPLVLPADHPIAKRAFAKQGG